MRAICERSLLSLVILFTKKGLWGRFQQQQPSHSLFIPELGSSIWTWASAEPGLSPIPFFYPHPQDSYGNEAAEQKSCSESRPEFQAPSFILMPAIWLHWSHVRFLCNILLKSFEPSGNSMGICERLMTGFHVWPGSLLAPSKPFCPVCHGASPDFPVQVLELIKTKRGKLFFFSGNQSFIFRSYVSLVKVVWIWHISREHWVWSWNTS